MTVDPRLCHSISLGWGDRCVAKSRATSARRRFKTLKVQFMSELGCLIGRGHFALKQNRPTRVLVFGSQKQYELH